MPNIAALLLTAIETEIVYKLPFNLLQWYTLVWGCVPGSKSFLGEVSMAIQSDSLQYAEKAPPISLEKFWFILSILNQCYYEPWI